MAAPIKIAIIGVGRAGYGMHLSEIKNRTDKFKVVAACDIEKSHLDKFKKDHPKAKTYSSIEELLKDKDVELVTVATRSPDHLKHAKMALLAGKYVFGEKPLSTKYTEALAFQKFLKANKLEKKFFVRHNRRFEAPFVEIMKIMKEGLLGKVYSVKLRRHGYQRRNDWQTLIKYGGGQLNNWGPHIVDHSLRFLESPVKEIWSDLKKVAAVGDAEDHLKIILKGENGRIVDMEISGGAAMPEPEYLISGDKGALSCTGTEIKLKYLNPKVKLGPCKALEDTPPLEGSFGNTEKLEWIEKTIKVEPVCPPCDTHRIWDFLFESIRSKKAFPIKYEEALEVVKVCSKVKKNSGFEKATMYV